MNKLYVLPLVMEINSTAAVFKQTGRQIKIKIKIKIKIAANTVIWNHITYF